MRADPDPDATVPTKPVLQYPGSKARMAPAIVRLLGKHAAYAEPYCGSAAVLLAKPRVWIETINDKHDMLIEFYSVLRDRQYRYDLVDALLNTPYAESELARCMTDDPNLDPVERARRFFVRTNQQYIGSQGSGKWTMTNSPTSGHSNATKWMNYVTRLTAMSERLQGVQISCRDGVVEMERLASMGKNESVAVYCDPPYLIASRNGTKYQVEGGDIEHHTALLEVLQTLSGPVVISAYDNDLYTDVLGADATWTKIARTVHASSSSGRGSVAKRTEILWVNKHCDAAAIPAMPVIEALEGEPEEISPDVTDETS